MRAGAREVGPNQWITEERRDTLVRATRKICRPRIFDLRFPNHFGQNLCPASKSLLLAEHLSLDSGETHDDRPVGAAPVRL
jgi:hypothetical protein